MWKLFRAAPLLHVLVAQGVREGDWEGKGEEVKAGDVVQITAEGHPWRGCFLFVDEVKSWGVQGFVPVPHSNEDGAVPSQAWNRLGFDQVEEVGVAPLAPAREVPGEE